MISPAGLGLVKPGKARNKKAIQVMISPLRLGPDDSPKS